MGSVVANDKPFSRRDYEKFDRFAKQCGREWMESLGMQDIEENLDEAKKKFNRIWDVGGRLPTPTGLRQIRLEFEVKDDWGTKWTGEEVPPYGWKRMPCPFPYDTIHFPYRKRDKAEEHATHMVIVGGDYSRLFIVDRQVMLASPVADKWCRNRRGMEPFFWVSLPAPKSCFYELNDNGIWVQSKQVFHAAG